MASFTEVVVPCCSCQKDRRPKPEPGKRWQPWEPDLARAFVRREVVPTPKGGRRQKPLLGPHRTCLTSGSLDTQNTGAGFQPRGVRQDPRATERRDRRLEFFSVYFFMPSR